MAAGMNSAGSGFYRATMMVMCASMDGYAPADLTGSAEPPSGAEPRLFRQSIFDQRLGISFTGWDPGRFDLNVQVNVSETLYLYKIIRLQRH